MKAGQNKSSPSGDDGFEVLNRFFAEEGGPDVRQAWQRFATRFLYLEEALEVKEERAQYFYHD